LGSLLLAAFLPATARIPTNKEAVPGVSSSALDPSHRIVLSEYQQPQAVPAHEENSWHRSLFDPISETFRALGGSGQHRSLGGGQSSMQHRQIYQQQEWAYNPETGELYWWIWLIIGLVSGLVGCCCCLSLFRFGSAKHYDQKVKEYQEHQREQRHSLFPNEENPQNNASEQQQ